MKRKKLRVIARPWQPRNIPYPVSQRQLKAFVQTHVQHFDEILYLGWVRRKEQGKRVIKFIVATGPTRLIAKKRFKESTAFGTEVWEVSNTQSADQALPDRE
jgi:hypothetical protein